MSYRPLKHFGQHLLKQPHYLNKIGNAINPQPDESLVEIGPGMGALTKIILPQCAHLHVVEIDKRFVEYLNTHFDKNKLTVHELDALRFDLRTVLASEQQTIRVIGNLPYNISTPLLFHLLEYKDHIHEMVFLLQAEVVARMAAQPGSKTYGRLSVMVQYHCHVKALFDVPPNAFIPPPKVNSTVVKLTPFKRENHIALDYAVFKDVVNQAFQQRRKTTKNALRALIDHEGLEAAGIDPRVRPETLSIEAFVNISNTIVKLSS